MLRRLKVQGLRVLGLECSVLRVLEVSGCKVEVDLGGQGVEVFFRFMLFGDSNDTGWRLRCLGFRALRVEGS